MQVFFVLIMPLIAAAIARGGIWKKLGWYSRTVILALISILAVAVIFSGHHPIALIVFPLSANFLMIALAASKRR